MEPARYFIRRNGVPQTQAPIEIEGSAVFFDDGRPLVDVWRYWRTMRKHLRLIIAVTLGVVILTAVKVMTQTPVYTAETTIMIQPQASDGGSDALENLVSIEAAAENSDQYYKTQCAILESRGLAASVIRTLGLEHNSAFAGEDARPDTVAQLGSNLTGSLQDLIAPSGKDAVVLPRSYADDRGVPSDLVHAYLDNLTVKPVEDTNLVKITFTSPDPALAAQVTNAHVTAYERQQIEMHSQQSEEAQRFLQNKLVDIKEQLQKSEAALNDYRRRKGIIPGLMSLDGKDAVVLDRLSDLSKDLTAAQVQRISLESQVTLIRKHQYNALADVENNLTVQDMERQLDSLYSEEAAFSSQFKADYPPLAKLQAQIHELQARVADQIQKAVGVIESQYAEAAEKENELEAETQRQRQETLNLNDAVAQYAILQRDVDTNRDLYNAVMTRMKDVAVSGDIQSSNVSVINSAEVPGAPSSPKKFRALMLALIGGLGAGIALAFTTEFLDNTLKNPEEAENYLHLPNLGVVPEFSSANGKAAYAPRQLLNGSTVLPPGRELVTTHGSYSRVGEAYRNLRTALLLSRAGGPPKVTLITSAMSREGKTVTAVNTAVMLAQLGGRVLLIDADLRRARCHRVLAVDNHLGLTEVLAGSRELHNMIRATEIQNLYFLGSGSVPPNPTELLGSTKMIETLLQLRDHYEYVVIDSAPVLPVSDSLVLAKLTDGVMLVANGAATPRQQVRTACARLEYAHAKILGVVLNKVKLHSADYHYYYHQDYYSFESDSLPDDEPA
jgi:polysaccharide biosynthesis transport protein